MTEDASSTPSLASRDGIDEASLKKATTSLGSYNQRQAQLGRLTERGAGVAGACSRRRDAACVVREAAHVSVGRSHRRARLLAMLTFIQMMALPEQERAAFGHPVMTVRWWDAEEVRTLTKQSWFGGLRGDLNKGAKVTLNLGVFKLEQGGVAREMSPVEQIGTVADLLENIEPLTASEFQKALNRSISTNRFESQLVVLQGQLRPQLSKRKAVELMVGHVADYVGLETQARERFRVIREAELDACIPKEGLNNAQTHGRRI